jgi:hypothetical protein
VEFEKDSGVARAVGDREGLGIKPRHHKLFFRDLKVRTWQKKGHKGIRKQKKQKHRTLSFIIDLVVLIRLFSKM